MGLIHGKKPGNPTASGGVFTLSPLFMLDLKECLHIDGLYGKMIPFEGKAVTN